VPQLPQPDRAELTPIGDLARDQRACLTGRLTRLVRFGLPFDGTV
jgi:hypothetical protein